MGKKEEEELLWEMINFELGETLEYLKDLKCVWQKLSSENRKLILHIVSGSLPSKKQIYNHAKDTFEPYSNEPELNFPEGTNIFCEGAEYMRDLLKGNDR